MRILAAVHTPPRWKDHHTGSVVVRTASCGEFGVAFAAISGSREVHRSSEIIASLADLFDCLLDQGGEALRSIELLKDLLEFEQIKWLRKFEWQATREEFTLLIFIILGNRFLFYREGDLQLYTWSENATTPPRRKRASGVWQEETVEVGNFYFMGSADPVGSFPKTGRTLSDLLSLKLALVQLCDRPDPQRPDGLPGILFKVL